MSRALRCRAALLALAAAAGLSLTPAARASLQLPGVESYSEEDTPAQAFVRRHFMTLIVAVPITAAVIYILIFGPSEVSDALRYARPHRSGNIFFGGGGFGSGGFGGG